jgi:hypothetical protein
MKNLLLIFLLISFNVFAVNNKHSLSLVEIKIRGFEIKISKNCIKSRNCDALMSFTDLTESKYEKIKDSVYGGRTAGDQICRELYKAEILYHKDKSGNETHFCKFKDGSYLETDYYGLIVNTFSE